MSNSAYILSGKQRGQLSVKTFRQADVQVSLQTFRQSEGQVSIQTFRQSEGQVSVQTFRLAEGAGQCGTEQRESIRTILCSTVHYWDKTTQSQAGWNRAGQNKPDSSTLRNGSQAFGYRRPAGKCPPEDCPPESKTRLPLQYSGKV